MFQTTPTATMAGIFGAGLNGGDLFKPGEYGSGDETLAIVTGPDGPEATTLTWGLEADWLPTGKLLRHARAETAMRKRTFSDSPAVRRGIAPVDAWVERATRAGTPRGAYVVRRRDGSRGTRRTVEAKPRRPHAGTARHRHQASDGSPGRNPPPHSDGGEPERRAGVAGPDEHDCNGSGTTGERLRRVARIRFPGFWIRAPRILMRFRI